MTRRFDHTTAEKVSLALLSRAAFGAAVGLRTASLYGVPASLAEQVFERDSHLTRLEIPGVEVRYERRNFVRVD